MNWNIVEGSWKLGGRRGDKSHFSPETGAKKEFAKIRL